MININKLIRYIFWCGGHLNYKNFGEDGHTGITLIVLNLVLLIGNVVSLIRVFLFGHTKFFTSEKYDFFIKIILALFILVLYYYFEKKFKNIGVKLNQEFNHIKKSKRIRDTFFIFLFLIFQFYIFLIIMSPSFEL